MTELISELNNMTLPGAIAFAGICFVFGMFVFAVWKK